MAVKIRLKRLGKKKAPFYRVVVMDSRTKRDGRAIEEIGTYDPMPQPSVISLDSDRALYWLGQGAQPTEAVAALLKVTGDLQKFKGEEGAEGTYKEAEEKEAFVAPEKGSVIVEKEDETEEDSADNAKDADTDSETEDVDANESDEDDADKSEDTEDSKDSDDADVKAEEKDADKSDDKKSDDKDADDSKEEKDSKKSDKSEDEDTEDDKDADKSDDDKEDK